MIAAARRVLVLAPKATLWASVAMICVGAMAAPGARPHGGSALAEPGTTARAILNGYRRYNATGNHCHGPDGLGSSFGPSLIETSLSLDAFRDVVMRGRARDNAVMRGYAGDPNVAAHIDDIHAYLLARSEGRTGRGRPAP